MQLSILSRYGTEFEGEAISLNVKTTSGEITVLDRHRPLISVLTPSTAVVVAEDGTRREIQIRGGFLEQGPENRLTLLIS